MCMSGGGDGGSAAAKKAEKKRRAAIAQGTESIDAAFAGFTPEYFGELEKSYVDYATPQLEDDYEEAARQMIYALDRKGLGASTAASAEQAKLEKQFGQYRTDVASSGKSYADTARNDVEDSRNLILNQLYATEDPAAANKASVNAAAIRSTPPAFSPVGSFVFNVSEGLRRMGDANDYRGLSLPKLTPSSKPSITYREG